MTCPICGHRPHPGFACNIPEAVGNGEDFTLCECPFEDRRTVFDTPSLFDAHVDGLPPPVRFDGETYEPPLDADRLGDQAKAVWRVMSGGDWLSLADIATRTGYPEASVSARLRDFRKSKFGGHTVERERVGGGLFRYRLVVEP